MNPLVSRQEDNSQVVCYVTLVISEYNIPYNIKRQSDQESFKLKGFRGRSEKRSMVGCDPDESRGPIHIKSDIPLERLPNYAKWLSLANNKLNQQCDRLNKKEAFSVLNDSGDNLLQPFSNILAASEGATLTFKYYTELQIDENIMYFAEPDLQNIRYDGPHKEIGDRILKVKANEIANAIDIESILSDFSATKPNIRENDYFESITSTGAIDLPPLGQPQKRKPKMRKKRNLKEWAPKFVGHEYSPGDAKMPTTGKGVAARNPKHMSVGNYDTEMHNQGEAWPRQHKETVAMCDVDEDGSESKPQGSHVSRAGKPEDHHTHGVGHDWPHQPKNRGGSSEPMKGNRYSDGGLLSTEEWSTNNISSLMEGEVNVGAIFQKYAESSQYVCMEDFQNLLMATGSAIKINNSFFEQLLENDRNFIFHEYEDATGKFYLVEDNNKDQFKIR